MKKIYIIISILIILIIIIKLIIINNYKIKDIKTLEKIKNGLTITDLKVINKKEVDNYLKYKNIKIEDIFNDSKCIEKNDIYKCSFDDKIITMGINKSFIDKYKTYTNSNIDIKDDLMLLGMIKESYNKPNIFIPISKLKREYNYNNFALKYIPISYSIDLIEGDYNGLLFYESEHVREFYLYKDNNTYIFNFKNIDNNTIINLISSIVID